MGCVIRLHHGLCCLWLSWWLLCTGVALVGCIGRLHDVLCFLTLQFGPLISEGWRLGPQDSLCLGSNQLGSQSPGLKFKKPSSLA